MFSVGAVVLLFAAGCMIPGRGPMCEVHHVKMKQESIPVVYGLPVRDEETQRMWEAERLYFPNAKNIKLGGCIVSDNSPDSAVTWECHLCRRARNEWLSDR